MEDETFELSCHVITAQPEGRLVVRWYHARSAQVRWTHA